MMPVGYFHLGLKPDNILVSPAGYLVLADFGSTLSVNYTGRVVGNPGFGFVGYEAPECYFDGLSGTKKGFTQKEDVWNIRLITVQTCHGHSNTLYWASAHEKIRQWKVLRMPGLQMRCGS